MLKPGLKAWLPESPFLRRPNEEENGDADNVHLAPEYLAAFLATKDELPQAPRTQVEKVARRGR
jgi:hypothetical protein